MPESGSLIFLLFGLALLAYYLFFYRRQLTEQRLRRAVEVLTEALYLDLYSGYTKEEPARTAEASALAATVVNEVFGFEPPDEQALGFRRDNLGQVQAQVAQVAGRSELRPLIAAALHYMEGPAWKKRRRPKGGLSRAANLGLVDPSEPPLPVHLFLARTAQYHRRVRKELGKG